MQWLEAAAKEMLDGAMKAMNELDMDSVDGHVKKITWLDRFWAKENL